jgi:transcription elongation factor Elf1
MQDKKYLDKRFDIRWTCPDCGRVKHSNKGYAIMQCVCKNMSSYMKKEYTDKGLNL